MSILGGGILGGGGDSSTGHTSGGNVFLGDIVGEFNAATVVQRAFTRGQLIFYDDGNRLRVYRASTDIPSNARLPTQNNSLWRLVPVAIDGVTEAELTQALQRYVLATDWDNDRTETDGEILALKTKQEEINDGLDDTYDKQHIDSVVRGLRAERSGVELLGEQVIFNLMQTDIANFTAERAAASPSFTRVDGLYSDSTGAADVVHLGRYDRFLFTVHLAAETAGNPTLEKTQFVMDYTDWFELKALPQSQQGAYQNARTQDNRALSFYWEVGDVDRTIYIGRTNDSNSRLTYAIRGWRSAVRMECRGYRGAA